MPLFKKCERLNNVSYAIRGAVYEAARDLEKKGHKITRLHIGNPAPFGFDVPDEIIQDIILNIRKAQGYSDHRGVFSARKAIMHYCQTRAIRNVSIDDILIGNGVSEIIGLALQALLNAGDEVLVPRPDYPLWTSTIKLYDGNPVHYICDEQSDWQPDVEDIRKKITPKTKAIVIINPNNPTGAVYGGEVLQKIVELAEEKGLIIFSDEIYDKILYDDTAHHPTATFVEKTLCVTMGGLSKNHRATGFRAGWMVLSGAREKAESYIEGLNTLASMRLCSNTIAQYGIQTALGGYQSITDLVLPGGRLRKQRDICYDLITQIPGITCVKPKGAMYLFPKIDTEMYQIKDDQELILDILERKKVLMVQGSGFNWHKPDHFRVVFLPIAEDLEAAMHKLKDYFEDRLERIGG